MGTTVPIQTVRVPAWFLRVQAILTRVVQGTQSRFVSPKTVLTHPVFNFYFLLRKLLQSKEGFNQTIADNIMSRWVEVSATISVKTLSIAVLKEWYRIVHLDPLSSTLSVQQETVKFQNYVHTELYDFVLRDLSTLVSTDPHVTELIHRWKVFAGLEKVPIVATCSYRTIGNGLGEVVLLVDDIQFWERTVNSFASSHSL